MTGFAQEPRHAEDLHAWHVLRPLLDAGRYLPWSTGAMRPAALVQVCNDIVWNARTHVVECGSGVSTVVLARLLRQLERPATLVSLEHDARWADLVTDLLEREGLGDVARVVHAPLEEQPSWYARDAVQATSPVIDLLVVDGPPAYAAGEGERRAPALATFDERLSPGATVVLDDANRPGEQRVLATWEATTPWRFTVDEASGLAVGHRES